MRCGQLRECTASQRAERESAGDEAGIAAHRPAHCAAFGATAGGDLIPRGEDVENVVVHREQVHVGDRLAPPDARLLAVERLARLLAAAYDYQRAAALVGEQHLALQEKNRLRRLRAGLQRIAAARAALEDRHLRE